MKDKLRETFVLFWDNFIEMIPRFLVAGVVLLVFILFGHKNYDESVKVEINT